MTDPDNETKVSPIQPLTKSAKLVSWSGARRIFGNWKFGVAAAVIFGFFDYHYEQKNHEIEGLLLGEWRCESLDEGVRSEGVMEFLKQNDLLTMRSVTRETPTSDETQFFMTQVVSVWRVIKGGAELKEEPQSISVSGNSENLGRFIAEFEVGSFDTSNPRVILVSIETDKQTASGDAQRRVAEILEEGLSNFLTDSANWQSEIVRIDESQLVLEYKEHVNSCIR